MIMSLDKESFEGTVKSNVLEVMQERILRNFLINTQPTDRQKEAMSMILDLYQKYGLSIEQGQSLMGEFANIEHELDLKYGSCEEVDDG